jgi:hypothetical protein
MPNHYPFSRLLRLLWDRSQLIAPARVIVEEAEDWTDYAAGSFYLAILFAVIYCGAVTFSTESILGLGAVAAAIFLVRIAVDRLR